MKMEAFHTGLMKSEQLLSILVKVMFYQIIVIRILFYTLKSCLSRQEPLTENMTRALAGNSRSKQCPFNCHAIKATTWHNHNLTTFPTHNNNPLRKSHKSTSQSAKSCKAFSNFETSVLDVPHPQATLPHSTRIVA